MSTRDDVERIERERKAREQALALWFLALAGRARRYVGRAIRVGTAWGGILRGVFFGNESLDLPGHVRQLRGAMVDTHRAGVRRVALLTGVTLSDAIAPDTLDRYQATAESQLERVHGVFERTIARGLETAAPADRIAADIEKVNEALRNGWSPDKPFAARNEATTTVTQAYATGMGQGFRNEQVQAITLAMRFFNPLDEKTTAICRTRHGTILPPSHPWLFRNFPPLHVGCRSLVLPVTRQVEFTENPPDFPPPEPGWGQWAGILSNAAYP